MKKELKSGAQQPMTNGVFNIHIRKCATKTHGEHTYGTHSVGGGLNWSSHSLRKIAFFMAILGGADKVDICADARLSNFDTVHRYQQSSGMFLCLTTYVSMRCMTHIYHPRLMGSVHHFFILYLYFSCCTPEDGAGEPPLSAGRRRLSTKYLRK